jgi:NitT/TauT family transport system permease protein
VLWAGVGKVLALGAGGFLLRGALEACVRVWERLDATAWWGLLCAGMYTLGRVGVATVVASLVWIPAGVWIARSPRLGRVAEPGAQMAAAFPINLLFPWMIAALASFPGALEWGSVILMTLASQWYVFFNVLAGLSALPGELEEAARVYRLRGWNLWRFLYLPAVFPHWVTGACTAAGGAWNASILAEYVTRGQTTLRATGLGADMADAAQRGDMPVLWASMVLMALLVAAANRFVWVPLYALAERRFHLD